MALGLEPLRIIKRWFDNTFDIEGAFDEIANKVGSWSSRTDNNLKQVGLDINGDEYSFNNNGKATQTSSIVSRLNALALSQAEIGTRNLSLVVSPVNIVKLVSGDGTDLSTSNIGYVTFSSTAVPGEIINYELTANLSITLTGAHWGLDTTGDYTDFILWLMLIEVSGTVILGVSARGGRDSIASVDTTTVNTSVSTRDKVFVSSTVGADGNATDIGFIKANFDDTGNAGGENYWTIQSGVGDIVFGQFHSIHEGTVIF